MRVGPSVDWGQAHRADGYNPARPDDAASQLGVVALARGPLLGSGSADNRLCQLGFALAASGQTDEAALAFTAGIHRSPSSARAWRGLGLAQAHSGNLATAAQSLATALQLCPEDAHTWCNLGSTLLLKGTLQPAARAYAEALMRRSDLYTAHVALGYIWARGLDYEGARLAYAAAVHLRPQAFDARMGLGFTYAKMGLHLPALQHLHAARMARPASPQVHHAIAKSRFALGDRSGALDAIHQTLRFNPHHRKAQRLRTRVLRESPESTDERAQLSGP